jgi:hypothetical protein
MKFCKAWPESCVGQESTTNLPPTTGSPTVSYGETKSQDALVWPKQLVDATVEASVQSLLLSAFPEKSSGPTMGTIPKLPQEETLKALPNKTVEVEDVPIEKTNDTRRMKHAKVISGSSEDTDVVVQKGASRIKATTDLTPVWVSLGIIGFLLLVLIWGLMQRVQSLESWLHGRLMSRP